MTIKKNTQGGAGKAPFALFAAVAVVLGAVGFFFVSGSGVAAGKKEEAAMNAVAPAAGEKKEEKKADKKAAASEAPNTQAAPAPVVKEGNPTVATVNGEDIKRSDILAFIGSLPPQLQQMDITVLFPMALDQVINNKLAMKKSGEAKMDADPEVTKLMDEAKSQIVRNVYVDRQVSEKINQKALLKKYEELLDRLGKIEEVKARHILLDSEEKAREAIKKLEAGGEFVAVTKEVWPASAEQNGGELGYFAKTDMVPEFAEAAFALGKGQYTKDPVKTQFGWHVILVEDKRDRPQPEYEAVKPQLEQQLRQEILAEMLKDWQKEAKVKKFDINGEPLKETKSN